MSSFVTSFKNLSKPCIFIFQFDEFSTNDFDDPELCKLLSECEQRLSDSRNDEMEEMRNTNENNLNEDGFPRNK